MDGLGNAEKSVPLIRHWQQDVSNSVIVVAEIEQTPSWPSSSILQSQGSALSSHHHPDNTTPSSSIHKPQGSLFNNNDSDTTLPSSSLHQSLGSAMSSHHSDIATPSFGLHRPPGLALSCRNHPHFNATLRRLLSAPVPPIEVLVQEDVDTEESCVLDDRVVGCPHPKRVVSKYTRAAVAVLKRVVQQWRFRARLSFACASGV